MPSSEDTVLQAMQHRQQADPPPPPAPFILYDRSGDATGLLGGPKAPPLDSPIIFLDIDGVLNNLASIGDGVSLVPEMVGRLNYLVESMEAAVLITSTWSSLHCRPKFWECLTLFALMQTGLRLPGNVLGYLNPAFKCSSDRYDLRTEASAQWLRKNRPQSFIILDDDRPKGGTDLQMQRWVQTKNTHGFNWKALQAAMALLDQKVDWPLNPI